MAFDLATAKPEQAVGFDLSTAQPIDAPAAEQPKAPQAPELNLDNVFPEKMTSMPYWKSVLGSLATFDTDAQRNILDGALQDAGVPHSFEKDAHGSDVLVYRNVKTGKQERATVNPKGISSGDVAGVVGNAVTFLGLGGIARAALGKVAPKTAEALASSWKARTAAAPLVAPVQQVGMDSAANAAGGEISAPQMTQNAVTAAALGPIAQVAGEGVAAAVPVVARGVRNAVRTVTQPAKGTPEAVTAIKTTVLSSADPQEKVALESMPDQWWNELATQIGDTTPTDAKNQAIANAFTTEIPGYQPVKPEVTGQVSDWQALDQAARGRYTPEVQNALAQTRDLNQQALANKVTDLKTTIGGVKAESIADAGDIARGDLRQAAATAKTEAGDRLNAALKQDGAVMGFSDLRGRFDAALAKNDVSVGGPLPDTFKATKQIQDIVSQEIAAIEAAGNSASEVSLQRIETLRRVIGKRIGAAGDNEDRRAATILKGEFDNWLGDQIDAKLYSGSVDVFDEVKGARAQWAEYAKTFREDKTMRTASGRSIRDVAGQRMEEIVAKDLSPAAVTDMLIGTGQLGRSPESLAILSRFQAAVGRDSEAFKAVQEAAVMRLFQSPTGELRTPKQAVDAWKTLQQTNPQMTGMLFGKEGKEKIGRLMVLMERMVMPKAAYVPSGPAIGQLQDVLKKQAVTLAANIGAPGVGHYIATEAMKSAEKATLQKAGEAAINVPLPTKYDIYAGMAEALKKVLPRTFSDASAKGSRGVVQRGSGQAVMASETAATK